MAELFDDKELETKPLAFGGDVDAMSEKISEFRVVSDIAKLTYIDL